MDRGHPLRSPSRERLAELRESGVNCLNVNLVGKDLKARVAQLDSLQNLIAKS